MGNSLESDYKGYEKALFFLSEEERLNDLLILLVENNLSHMKRQSKSMQKYREKAL